MVEAVCDEAVLTVDVVDVVNANLLVVNFLPAQREFISNAVSKGQRFGDPESIEMLLAGARSRRCPVSSVSMEEEHPGSTYSSKNPSSRVNRGGGGGHRCLVQGPLESRGGSAGIMRTCSVICAPFAQSLSQTEVSFLKKKILLIKVTKVEMNQGQICGLYGSTAFNTHTRHKHNRSHLLWACHIGNT